MTHSLCPRHVGRNNYVPLFGVDPIECRLTRYYVIRDVIAIQILWPIIIMYNCHPSSPSLPSIPPSLPPLPLPPSLPPSPPLTYPPLPSPPLPSYPSLPLPSPPLPPSLPSLPLPLVTQQMYCPFQRKQSPSYTT